MEKLHREVEKKKAYEKPVLRKHGNLKELTAVTGKISSSGRKAELGCTRM